MAELVLIFDCLWLYYLPSFLFCRHGNSSGNNRIMVHTDEKLILAVFSYTCTFKAFFEVVVPLLMLRNKNDYTRNLIFYLYENTLIKLRPSRLIYCRWNSDSFQFPASVSKLSQSSQVLKGSGFITPFGISYRLMRYILHLYRHTRLQNNSIQLNIRFCKCSISCKGIHLVESEFDSLHLAKPKV